MTRDWFTTFMSSRSTAVKRSRTARRGDKVVVRLEAWESRHVNPEGKIIERLGPRTAPGVDILSIIRKYDLPLEFPKAVLEEASAIPETVTLTRRSRGSTPAIHRDDRSR